MISKCVALFLLIFSCIYVQTSAQTLDRNIFTTDGPVYSTVQSGDTAYVAGQFKHMGYSTRKLARFVGGSTKPDLTFPQLDGNSTINAIEPDGNGGYYLGGKIYYYNNNKFSQNNSSVAGVIHILSNYLLDPAFVPSDVQGNIVRCLKKMGNRLYVGGDFTYINNTSIKYLAALDITSGALSNWIPETPNNAVNKIEATDSLVFITGSFYNVGKHYTIDGFAAFKTTDGGYVEYLSSNNNYNSITTLKISNNKLYVGGTFNNIGHPARGLARVSSSTAVQDIHFPKTNGSIYALLADNNGGYYVGGSFSLIGEISRQNIAHILTDGTIDSNFNISVNSAVICLATDNTNLYFGGYFTSVNSSMRNYAAAVSRRTNKLTAWNPNANSYVNTMVYANNAVYLGGDFTAMKSNTRNYAAAVNTNNALTQWNPNLSGSVYQLITNNNKTSVFMCGNFYTVKGTPHQYLVKVNSTTGIPASWNPNISDRVYSLVLNGSQLFIGGDFRYVNYTPRQYFAGLDTTAGYLTAFQADADNTIRTLNIIDNKLYLGGIFAHLKTSYYTQSQTYNIGYAARINLATSTVDDWNAGLGSSVSAFLGDGNNIILGGSFSSVNGGARANIAAMDLTTNQLTSFSPAVTYWSVNSINALYVFNHEVFAGGNFSYHKPDSSGFYSGVIALDADSGKITRYFDYTAYQCSALAISNNQLFIGGQFTEFYDSASYFGIRTIFRYNLATYNLSDNHLTSDDYKLDNKVDILLSDANNGIIAAGDFTLTNFTDRQNLAAINLTTGQPTNWIAKPEFIVRAMALKDTSLFVGGYFTGIINSNNVRVKRKYLAAVSTITGNTTDWNPGANQTVECMALQDTTLYVGGDFTKVKDVTRNYAAAIGTSGTGIVNNWVPNSNSTINAIQPSGNKIYLSGDFNLVNKTLRHYLALVNNTDGSLDAWNPNPNYRVYALDTGGANLYVGGSFNSISSQSRQAVAAFNMSTNTLTSFDPELKNQYGNGFGLSAVTVYGRDLYMSSGYNKDGDYSMDSIKGKPRHVLGAADTATGNATPFHPDPDDRIHVLKAKANKLFVGVDYTSISIAPSSAYFSVFNLEPLTQASNLTFTSLQPTAVTANWINGSGEGRIVVVKEGSKANAPADGSGYNANVVFGQGSNVNENYVVYKDSGSSVNVINLLPNHTYYFAVYEYNGSNSGTEYLQMPSLNGSITTPCPAYTNIVSPAGPVTFCQGGSAVLTAIDSMLSYKWNTNDTTQSITITASGSYTVAIADSNACTANSQPVVASYNSCGKPAGLAANTITSTSATLRWKSVPCAVMYNVQYRKDGAVAWITKSTADTTITITGLSPNTTYNARIQTVCTLGKSDYTAINNFTTAASLIADAANSKMKEAEAAGAVIYPNPASDNATVEFNAAKSGAYTLQITDATGKILMTKHAVSVAGKNIILIDVKHFAQGMYMVSITDENGKQTIKLNKE